MASDPDPQRPIARKARTCPICGKPASQADAPFCSKRCADVDLHRWLSGHYVLPSGPDDLADTDEPPERD